MKDEASRGAAEPAADSARAALLRVPVREEIDVAVARRCAYAVAREEGLAEGAAARVATAASEVARNVLVHATRGEVLVGPLREQGRRGVLVVARDGGPGIADLEAAMRDGYSTAGGLGLGLPGARRLMDEFTIESAVGGGTTVTMKKWCDG